MAEPERHGVLSHEPLGYENLGSVSIIKDVDESSSHEQFDALNHTLEEHWVHPNGFRTHARSPTSKRGQAQANLNVSEGIIYRQHDGDLSEKDDALQVLRAATPDQQTLFEGTLSAQICLPPRSKTHNISEPSSALGSKILRAHDNPSPPPQAHSLSDMSDDEDEARLVDISVHWDPSIPVTASTPSAHGLSTDTSLNISPFTHTPGMPLQIPQGTRGTLDEDMHSPNTDLISFDASPIPFVVGHNGQADLMETSSNLEEDAINGLKDMAVDEEEQVSVCIISFGSSANDALVRRWRGSSRRLCKRLIHLRTPRIPTWKCLPDYQPVTYLNLHYLVIPRRRLRVLITLLQMFPLHYKLRCDAQPV
jgi:hypothetical protein